MPTVKKAPATAPAKPAPQKAQRITDPQKRVLSRAIHQALRYTGDAVAGEAFKVTGRGFTVTRYFSQGKDKPGSEVVVLTLFVGADHEDRFGVSS